MHITISLYLLNITSDRYIADLTHFLKCTTIFREAAILQAKTNTGKNPKNILLPLTKFISVWYSVDQWPRTFFDPWSGRVFLWVPAASTPVACACTCTYLPAPSLLLFPTHSSCGHRKTVVMGCMGKVCMPTLCAPASSFAGSAAQCLMVHGPIPERGPVVGDRCCRWQSVVYLKKWIIVYECAHWNKMVKGATVLLLLVLCLFLFEGLINTYQYNSWQI